MDSIKTFLERVNLGLTPKIAVVGDAMIDEYFYVDANRVSPEFPIPVMKSWPDAPYIVVPGGAGNVCNQFKHFPFDVCFYGFLDERGREVMDQTDLKHNAAFLDEQEAIPRKRRFYHGQFPLCRWDVEEKDYGITDKDRLMIHQGWIKQQLQKENPHVIILSDYDKGVFSNNWWLNPNDVGESITIVDPKKGPLSKWGGCSVFKPNTKEAYDLSGGRQEWQDQCKYFNQQLQCPAVVITQGGDGVVGLVMGKFFEYHPTRKVYADSVIGAGDCFMAFLAMALAHSIDIQDAVEIAFEAGAIYVERKHNEPVAQHELLAQADPEASKLRKPPKERDYKLVFTNGCFDILHEGHLATLRRARALGDKLVVAVNSDESIQKIKGDARPIIALKERMKMLAGLECVDFVVEFGEDTPYNIIKEIQPDVLVKGQDWEGNIVGSDIVPEVHALPLLKGLSTSEIISKIKESEIIE